MEEEATDGCIYVVGGSVGSISYNDWTDAEGKYEFDDSECNV